MKNSSVNANCDDFQISKPTKNNKSQNNVTGASNKHNHQQNM